MREKCQYANHATEIYTVQILADRRENIYHLNKWIKTRIRPIFPYVLLGICMLLQRSETGI